MRRSLAVVALLGLAACPKKQEATIQPPPADGPTCETVGVRSRALFGESSQDMAQTCIDFAWPQTQIACFSAATTIEELVPCFGGGEVAGGNEPPPPADLCATLGELIDHQADGFSRWSGMDDVEGIPTGITIPGSIPGTFTVFDEVFELDHECRVLTGMSPFFHCKLRVSLVMDELRESYAEFEGAIDACLAADGWTSAPKEVAQDLVEAQMKAQLGVEWTRSDAGGMVDLSVDIGLGGEYYLELSVSDRY